MTPEPPAQLPESVGLWLAQQLGARPVEVFFHRASMSQVWGVLLDDERRVAVKVRGDGSRLEVACRAQEAARSAGVDCPRVLIGPTRLPGIDESWVTVEEWRGEGEVEPPGDPAEHYGRLLAQVNAALRDLPDAEVASPPWLDYNHGAAGRTWPPPMSDRWDPHRIEAEMPGELLLFARSARERLLASPLPWVLMHGDLNPANVRWIGTGDAVRALVHDWDSVVVAPEAVVAGEVALDLTMLPGRERMANIATCAGLLDAFGRARGVLLSREETEVAWAATAWVGVYNAAFEYLHGAPGALAEQILSDGRERLRLAGVDV